MELGELLKLAEDVTQERTVFDVYMPDGKEMRFDCALSAEMGAVTAAIFSMLSNGGITMDDAEQMLTQYHNHIADTLEI